VKLQNEASEDDKLIFSIVGWHAITLPQRAKELSASRWDMLATLLAIGIDPKRSILFHQDDVCALSPGNSVNSQNITESMSYRVGLDIQLYHPGR
jgi:tryptophanyl-tRNA synthetase